MMFIPGGTVSPLASQAAHWAVQVSAEYPSGTVKVLSLNRYVPVFWFESGGVLVSFTLRLRVSAGGGGTFVTRHCCTSCAKLATVMSAGDRSCAIPAKRKGPGSGLSHPSVGLC